MKFRTFVLMSLIFFGVLIYLLNADFGTPKVKAATHDVALSTTVLTALTFDISAGDTVSFGDLTPGSPIAAPAGPPAGTITTVTTNAANGYTIGVSDGSDTNSALAQGGTYIADYAGTIGTPTAWIGTGLGITLWTADTTPEGKYCATTCTTYNDTDNKYAGVPSAATTAHTAAGYKAAADTASWAFKIDTPATQLTGAYTGNITFTATAVLS